MADNTLKVLFDDGGLMLFVKMSKEDVDRMLESDTFDLEYTFLPNEEDMETLTPEEVLKRYDK